MGAAAVVEVVPVGGRTTVTSETSVGALAAESAEEAETVAKIPVVAQPSL